MGQDVTRRFWTRRGPKGLEPVGHRFFAWWYPRLATQMDQHGFVDHRRATLDGLRGQVIEIGPGHGPNFTLYPRAVTSVLAVEPDPAMRRQTIEAAAEVNAAAAASARPDDPGLTIEVVDGSAERIPAAAASFDAAVVVLVLCSVRDQAVALAEIHRVLRPGGRLHFLEHVRSESRPVAFGQRLLDASGLWPAVGAGCHCSRDTLARITQAGFTVIRADRFSFPDARPQRPTVPHVAGVAVK